MEINNKRTFEEAFFIHDKKNQEFIRVASTEEVQKIQPLNKRLNVFKKIFEEKKSYSEILKSNQ